MPATGQMRAINLATAWPQLDTETLVSDTGQVDRRCLTEPCREETLAEKAKKGMWGGQKLLCKC